MPAVEPDCQFCQIIQGTGPARVVAQDAHALAFFPLRPVSRGHTLVVPRAHVADLWSADPALAGHVIQTVVRVGHAIRAALLPDGLNLISSAGEAASQTVFHLHLHVVPRWAGDHIGNIWPPGERVDEAAQDQSADMIRNAYRALARLPQADDQEDTYQQDQAVERPQGPGD